MAATFPVWPADRPQPLQQHPAYGQALGAYGAQPSLLTLYQTTLGRERLLGFALLLQRRFFKLVRLATLFRGPCWEPGVSTADKTAALKALRKQYPKYRWSFLALMPEEFTPPPAQSPSPYQAAGFKRVMTGVSTLWLDLKPEPDLLRRNLDGKWRNQLVKAEKSQINIHTAFDKATAYTWLLDVEQAQRKARSYRAPPHTLVSLFAAAAGKKSVLCVTAHKGGQKVAGGLFLLHGRSATYHIGWSGPSGRAVNAQNLVLWQALIKLRQAGITYLDMGGLNTDQIPGIARFKLGLVKLALHDTPLTLEGTFM